MAASNFLVELTNDADKWDFEQDEVCTQTMWQASGSPLPVASRFLGAIRIRQDWRPLPRGDVCRLAVEYQAAVFL